MPIRVILNRFLPTSFSPRQRSAPLVGRATPVIVLKQVVLPAPFGPISPRISPLYRVKSTPSRATTPPKRMVTSSTSSRGSRSAIWSLNDARLPSSILEFDGPPTARQQALRPEDGHRDQSHPE